MASASKIFKLGDFAILAPKLLDPFLPYHKVGTSPFVGSPQRGT
jgi:hypothetical protein